MRAEINTQIYLVLLRLRTIYLSHNKNKHTLFNQRRWHKYCCEYQETCINPLTAGAVYIRVFIFYKHIKYHFLKMVKIKCDIISKIWKELTSILSNLNKFRSLEVVDRVSETQIQVGENSNWKIWQLKGWDQCWSCRPPIIYISIRSISVILYCLWCKVFIEVREDWEQFGIGESAK